MRRIRSLEGLAQAAQRKRAVFVSLYGIRMPAAFVLGMPAQLVLRYIRGGLVVWPRNRRAPSAKRREGRKA